MRTDLATLQFEAITAEYNTAMIAALADHVRETGINKIVSLDFDVTTFTHGPITPEYLTQLYEVGESQGYSPADVDDLAKVWRFDDLLHSRQFVSPEVANQLQMIRDQGYLILGNTAQPIDTALESAKFISMLMQWAELPVVSAYFDSKLELLNRLQDQIDFQVNFIVLDDHPRIIAECAELPNAQVVDCSSPQAWNALSQTFS